eukprot:scaffold87981_cov21-Tisochrysis_lutea.AAC.2
MTACSSPEQSARCRSSWCLSAAWLSAACVHGRLSAVWCLPSPMPLWRERSAADSHPLGAMTQSWAARWLSGGALPRSVGRPPCAPQQS